jgi:hypothetical protein
MRQCVALSVFALSAFSPILAQTNQPFTAEQIMQRVAANQDSAEQLRRKYVYKQQVHVISRKTNGKLMREETANYDVIPDERGSNKQLKQLLGKYWHKDQYLNYSGEDAAESNSLDADLVHDLRTDLADEKRSKDGLAVDLFPLTSKEQSKYTFRLLGEATLNGRNVYHIAFRPKDNSAIVWKGEAFIDKEDFQPVSVFTKLSRKVPFLVRTALGTDLPGLGFSVSYKRQPDGAWFPVSFGTEFRLRALFVINRNISVALQNSDFEKTYVDSAIHYEDSAH